MAIDAQMPFEEFLERVTSKFGVALGGLGMKFKDEDGGKKNCVKYDFKKKQCNVKKV